MSRYRKHLPLLTALLLPVACNADQEPATQPQLGVAPQYQGKLSSLSAVNVRDAQLEEIVSGLNKPRAFEFLDEKEIILTEIGGTLKRLDLTTGATTEIGGLPDIAASHDQTGLLDVALHPEYTDNGRIYFSYSMADEATGKYFLTAVSTAILNGNQLEDVHQILAAAPFGWSPSNFGGALEFDADGYLFVSVGDRSEHQYSQHGDRLEGKLLRLNDDGSVPGDNPFVGDDSVDDRIYAIGVRNAQGLYFDQQTGQLFESEHGPLGGDEVNVITAGANYGWPDITYGKNYTTANIGVGTHSEGMQQPLFYYLPSEAISPLTMYRGSMFPEWEGDLLVGTLKGKHISKLDLDGGVIRSEYPILNELNARIRDIKVASDGSVYILVQTGVLYRLYREPAGEFVAPPAEGQQVYEMVCAGCHDAGAGEAPQLGSVSDWQDIRQQPFQVTLQHTINGYNDMPERGLCGICADEHLEAAVKYMLDQAQPD